MELISLSDFVLEVEAKLKDAKIDTEYEILSDIITYAKFLKTELTVEMFKSGQVFEDVSIDMYNKIFCRGYVGDIVRGKLFSQNKTIEDLVGRGISVKFKV